MCIGDGKTDEVLFQLLLNEAGNGDNIITATVGKKQTLAKCYIPDVEGVEKLLVELSLV